MYLMMSTFIKPLLYLLGLYFSLGSRILADGDSVNITDIGSQPMDDRTYPGNTLVCNTMFVNMHCCRSSDHSGNEPIGSWHFPNQSAVIHNNNRGNSMNILARVVYVQQVCLASIGLPVGPLGMYRCSVLQGNGNLINSTINIINVVSGKKSKSH